MKVCGERVWRGRMGNYFRDKSHSDEVESHAYPAAVADAMEGIVESATRMVSTSALPDGTIVFDPVMIGSLAAAVAVYREVCAA